MIVLDSSVAIPALHPDLINHDEARPLLERRPSLAQHALVETFSVLTRLPDPFRVDPVSAARLIRANFDGRVVSGPSAKALVGWMERIAGVGIRGAAIYDALVAESARAAGATLVTADRRAAKTYQAVGAEVEFLGD